VEGLESTLKTSVHVFAVLNLNRGGSFQMKKDRLLDRRLQFVLYGIFAILIGMLPGCQQSSESKSRTDVLTMMRTRPSWLREKPLVQAQGNHEPLIFIPRRGHAQSHFRIQQEKSGKGYRSPKEAWLDMFSDETIERQREYGNTFWLSHLHKGFGLDAEREDREYLKSLVPKLHENGFKVAGYVGSSLIPETFLLENPEAINWLASYEYFGKPVHYTTQTFRHRLRKGRRFPRSNQALRRRIGLPKGGQFTFQELFLLFPGLQMNS
jgi:hypothetical protein